MGDNSKFAKGNLWFKKCAGLKQQNNVCSRFSRLALILKTPSNVQRAVEACVLGPQF